MIIAYPLSPLKDYTELRYSLRSVEKHIPGPYEILVIGSVIPDWLTGITWIQLDDIKGRKQLSIKRKIIAALRYTDEILFMNDDVYLLQPWQRRYYLHDIYYYSGDLKHIGESGAKPLRNELEAMGKPTKNFDTHSPLVYDRRFIDIVELFTADTVIKSMYCNYLDIEGVAMRDGKINKKVAPAEVKKFIEGRIDFSSGPQGVSSVVGVLEEMFNEPSKYEVV